MATIITLDDKKEEIKIYSSFITEYQLETNNFIERCEADGAVVNTKTCIINDYINDY